MVWDRNKKLSSGFLEASEEVDCEEPK
jgi:hypothetical protein